MYQKNLDMIVVVTLCLLNVLWVLLPFHNIPGVGMVLALPLVFLLPGYVLLHVLLPRRQLDRSQQLAFSLGLSLVLAIIAGLVLNMFPAGLSATSWAIFLGLSTLGGALLVIFLRRGKTTIEEQVSLKRWRPTHLQLLALELAVVVAVLSVMYSASGVLQGPQTQFTQLSLLPATHVRQQCTVQLGVQNFEASARAYHIEMAINGTISHTWSSVVLEPQHSWEQQIPLVAPKTGTLSIVARLYENSDPKKIYRSVNLTLHALTSPPFCKE